MAVVEGEIHTLFLERHGVVIASQLDDLDILDAKLIAPGMPGARLSSRTGPEMITEDSWGRRVSWSKNSLGKVTFESDTLYEAGTIPHEQENQLAFIGAVVDPALNGDFLAGIFGYLFHANKLGAWCTPYDEGIIAHDSGTSRKRTRKYILHTNKNISTG